MPLERHAHPFAPTVLMLADLPLRILASHLSLVFYHSAATNTTCGLDSKSLMSDGLAKIAQCFEMYTLASEPAARALAAPALAVHHLPHQPSVPSKCGRLCFCWTHGYIVIRDVYVIHSWGLKTPQTSSDKVPVDWQDALLMASTFYFFIVVWCFLFWANGM